MHEGGRDRLDERLTSMFQQAIEPSKDDDFRPAVVRRIQRRMRLRRIVLGTSIAAGALIALVPAYELTLAFSDRLVELFASLNGIDLQPESRVFYLVSVAALLSPVLSRLLED